MSVRGDGGGVERLVVSVGRLVQKYTCSYRRCSHHKSIGVPFLYWKLYAMFLCKCFFLKQKMNETPGHCFKVTDPSDIFFTNMKLISADDSLSDYALMHNGIHAC